MPEKDLYDKIRDREFTLTEPMPKRPVKPTLGQGHDSKQAAHYAAALEDYEKLMKVYHEEIEKRRKMDNDLRMKFKAEAIEYCGLTGHPKAERAWSLAWDRGHSAGYNDVLLELEELAGLIID